MGLRFHVSELRLLGLLTLNAMLACALEPYFGESSAYYQCALLIGLFSVCAALAHFRYNFVYQIRIGLLITIGYYAGLVKWYEPSAFFSPVETPAQTFEVGARMFVLTSLALLGGSLGFMLAKPASALVVSEIKNTPVAVWRWLLLLSFSATLVAGYLSARSYGPTVFEGVYGTGEGSGQLLGNLQSMGVVCLVLVFIAYARLGRRGLAMMPVLLAVYYLGWGIFIRGGRLEFLSGILALLVAVPAVEGKVFRLRALHYIALIVLAFLMELWGNLRSTLATESAETLVEGYVRLADMGIYHAGTISGIATTFSNMLHMMARQVVEPQWGATYLEYILRSPPEFLYPGRPPDLSLMFLDHGYASVGGIFELAEAYYNFGAIGCLVMPLLVSFALSKIYMGALRGNWLRFFLLTAVLSVFFRGAWYQIFAFYKSLLTGLTFFGLYWAVRSLVCMKYEAAKQSLARP